jgi:L-threonylcarbamoyladenylate synthase
MLLLRGEQSRILLVKHLKAGRIAAMACDTIYGFVGRAPEAENSIRQIKGRGDTKPFLQLIHDINVLDTVGAIVPPSDILNLWPGPFTFVFSTRTGGTTAFRIPEDNYLRSLIREVGAPLYSTSVNRAGMPPMEDPVKIDSEFGGELALIENSGTFQGRQPSTVVDLSTQPFRILRQGSGIVPPNFL